VKSNGSCHILASRENSPNHGFSAFLRSEELSDNRDQHGGLGLDVWCDSAAERQTIQRELAAAPDDTARSALLLFELGRIALSDGDRVEAAQFLLRSYSQQPSFRPTLRLARHIYRDQRDPRLLVKLLDAEARATRDHLTRAHLYRQQARALWFQLNELPPAQEKLEESIRLDPSELASSKMLELILATCEAHQGRIALVDQQLQMVSDTTARIGLLADLALLHFDEEPNEAIRLLQDASREGPNGSSLLLLLEQFLAAAHDDEQLAVVLERQAEGESADLLWKGSLLARAARLAAQRGYLDRSFDLFMRSADVDPYPDTLADCMTLLLGHGRIEQAVYVGERLFGLLDTPRLRAALACELADYFRLTLSDDTSAVDWYRRCLSIVPSYQPALEGLSALCAASGDLESQLEIHLNELASLNDSAARAHRLFRIGDLLERHGREDEALEMHRQALADKSDFLPSMLSLERLLERSGRWTELLDLHERQLAHETDEERVVHLLETMAGIRYHYLDQPDRAVDCYLQVVERMPTHLGAVSTAARLCAEAGRWRDLVVLYEREIDLTTDGQRRLELLQRAGDVWESRLFDLEHAIDCYRRALDFNPEFLPALRALGRLYRQKGRWKDLIAMHQAEANVCADAEHAIALLCTIAEVYEEELLDEEAAAQAYSDVLARRPGYLHAIESLARIWEQLGRWGELVDLLLSSIDLIEDKVAQATVLCRVGVLRAERLADTELAIQDLRQALRLAPDLVPARAMLEYLLVSAEAEDQFVELLEEQIGHSSNLHERAQIARQLGELAERTRQDPSRAAAYYEQSIEAEPDLLTAYSLARLSGEMGQTNRYAALLEFIAAQISDERFAAEIDVRVGQLKAAAQVGDPLPHYTRALQLGVGRAHAERAMERYVRDTRQYARLPDVLAARIERTTDKLELACLFSEIAQCYQELGDSSAAEQAYRSALEHDAKHVSALWGLGRLLALQERWPECVEIAEREAAACGSVRGTAAALLRAAELARELLRDEERALPLYKQVLRLQPGHAHAYDCLRAILMRRESWAELASLMRAQISATDDEQQQARIFEELGYLYLDRLSQQLKGEACLRRLISLEPDNMAALTTLGDLYSSRQEWHKAEVAYARAVEAADGPDARAATRRRLGQVYRQLGRAADALVAFREAAVGGETWPDSWLLRQIAETAEETGDYLEQANALDQLADVTEDDGERLAARKQVAQISEQYLDDEERAIRSFQQVLVADPLELDTVERLAALYGRSSNRAALTQHLQAAVAHHRAAIADSPTEGRLYEQLARIYRWQRQYDRYYCVCLVLKHMGTLPATEEQFLDEHGRLCAAEPRLPLDPSAYDQLFSTSRRFAPVLAMFRLLAPAAVKALAVDPSRWGLGRSDRVNKHPQRSELMRLSGIVGSELEFDLWLLPGADGVQSVAEARSFGRLALVLDRSLVEGQISLAHRFHLGRAFMALNEPLLLLSGLDALGLDALLSSLIRQLKPVVARERSAGESAEIEELATRIIKATPRKSKRGACGVPECRRRRGQSCAARRATIRGSACCAACGPLLSG
jgi:tetratricopeptide (TPR) repeat protein